MFNTKDLGMLDPKDLLDDSSEVMAGSKSSSHHMEGARALV